MTTAVLNKLQSHRSIRQFTDSPVGQNLLEQLIACGQSAASSSFIQATTIIQIDQGLNRQKLADLSGNQQYVATAPVFLVFCADMNRHYIAGKMHGIEILSGFTEQFLTATVDVSLFAQNLVVAAESEGLGVCYIGGIRNNIAQVSELLALPDLVFPVFGLCLGYPAEDPEVKPRIPISLILKRNQYNQDTEINQLSDYDQQLSNYYQQRTSNKKVMGWTEQLAAMLVKEARPHMAEFLRQKGFLLK